MGNIWNRIKGKLHEISTKFGIVLGAISIAAPNYAQFDPRIAYLGMIASLLLVIYKEKPSGDPQ